MTDRMGIAGRARTAREVREERLRQDPEFRAYWARTALARAVAHAVIRYRVEHKLSQAGLAERLGTRQSAVARLEAGEHTPTLETLLRLSAALGIEILMHVAPGAPPEHWPELQQQPTMSYEVAASNDPLSAILVATR